MNSTLKTIFVFIKNNTFSISLVSAALCGLTYLYQVLMLRKWEIPLGMVDGLRMQYLFVIVLGLLYFFSAAYLQEYIRLRFYYYVPIRLANKTVEQLMKKARKTFPDKFKGNVSKRIEKIECRCKKIRYGILKTIIFVVLIGALCFLPIYILYFILILNSDWLMVLVLFCFTMCVMIASVYLIVGKPARNKIKCVKEKYINDNSTFENYLSACNEIVCYEEVMLLEADSKKQHSDNVDYLTVAITAIAMFFFGMSMSFCSAPPKKYWVYVSESGDNYASVFEIGDIFVLKRIDIEDNYTKLVLNDQLIVNAGDKKFTLCTFEDVLVER